MAADGMTIAATLALSLAAACSRSDTEVQPGSAAAKPATAPASPPKSATGDAIVDDYLRVAAALARDSTEGVEEAVRRLEGASGAAGKDGDVGRAAATLRGKDLAAARKAFATLSRVVIRRRNRLRGVRSKTVLLYCPMAKASWLQTDRAVANPYYGSEMRTCGTVVEAPLWDDVRPALSRQCARCHGPSPEKMRFARKAMAHVDMSVFPFRSHHPDVLRRIEEALTPGKDGRITMPADVPGGMSNEADAKLILAWVRGGGLGPDGVPPNWGTAAPGGHKGHESAAEGTRHDHMD